MEIAFKVENNVYDVEMQTTGNRSVLYSDMDQETVIRELPLRTRYYQSIISTNMLRNINMNEKAFAHFECQESKFCSETLGESLPVWDERHI